LISTDETVNETKINHVDLSEPIIIALFENNSHIVIDGIHRLRKAKKNNVEHILAYIIPFEKHINFITRECDFYDVIEKYNTVTI